MRNCPCIFKEVQKEMLVSSSLEVFRLRRV